MEENTKMTQEDQIIMLRVKSLLNHLRYFIKDEDLKIVDKYHTLCRKYCSWEVQKMKKIQPNWYKINGLWYHCITINNKRYINGIEQTD